MLEPRLPVPKKTLSGLATTAELLMTNATVAALKKVSLNIFIV